MVTSPRSSKSHGSLSPPYYAKVKRHDAHADPQEQNRKRVSRTPNGQPVALRRESSEFEYFVRSLSVMRRRTILRSREKLVSQRKKELIEQTLFSADYRGVYRSDNNDIFR
jgi:hypothetical protein